MKKLNQFLEFNHELFLRDKKFIVKGTQPYFEYVDGKRTEKQLGTTIICLISSDKTKYIDNGQEVVGVNELEEIRFKVPNNNDLELPYKALITPLNIMKCSVYGEFRNNLSIECEKVVINEKN